MATTRKVKSWLATHPVAVALLAALLGAAVGRGIIPADLGLCLDALLAPRAEDSSLPSISSHPPLAR